jgi:predicted AlkP superfamily pyrophosphatase or phosphodiesterase
MRYRVVVLLALLASAVAAAADPLLLISIDGLHPDYVLHAEKHGLEIPRLRKYVEEGTYARGVIGVVPTVTYPSHTTIVTGVAPAEHGIASNTPFDPFDRNKEGWYWYAEDVRVPTLFDAAAAAGLTTAAVNWPATVGDRHIDYLLPEFWRASNAEDLKLLRALARPEGFMEELEARIGPFVDGYIDTLASDEIRTNFAVALLRERKPAFMAVHLIALDGAEHRQGPFVPEVYRTLEAIDAMIGALEDAALAANPSTAVAIVSDHGFIGTHTAVNLRTAFVEAGLIELGEGSAGVLSWDAQLWPGAAVAAVVLRDPDDRQLRARAAALLEELSADPANGIATVLDAAELSAAGAFPGASWLIEFAPGFYFGGALRGDLLTAGGSKGTHGYLPERPELHAAFFVRGQGIARNADLGVIDIRRIAPTLGGVLGVDLPTARLQPLSIDADHGKR